MPFVFKHLVGHFMNSYLTFGIIFIAGFFSSCRPVNENPLIILNTNNVATVQEAKLTESVSESARLLPMGYYSDLRTDGEHDTGFTLEFWRQGDQLVGVLRGSSSLRMSGDPPTGLIKEIGFDKRSGHLTFSCGVPVVYYSSPGMAELRREWTVYRFDGSLRSRQILGQLRATDTDSSRNIPLKLRYSKRLTKEMIPHKNVEELLKDYRISDVDAPDEPERAGFANYERSAWRRPAIAKKGPGRH